MRKSLGFLLRGSPAIRFNKINLQSSLQYRFSSASEDDSHSDFKPQSKTEGLPKDDLHEKIQSVVFRTQSVGK